MQWPIITKHSGSAKEAETKQLNTNSEKESLINLAPEALQIQYKAS